MYHALDLGLTVQEFWEMSPRGVWLLQQQLIRQLKRQRGMSAGEDRETPVRLNYIPR